MLSKLKSKTFASWFVGFTLRNSINRVYRDWWWCRCCHFDTTWPIKRDILWWFASIVTDTSFRCFCRHRCGGRRAVAGIYAVQFNVRSCACFVCPSQKHRIRQRRFHGYTLLFLLLFAFAALVQLSANNLSPPRCGLRIVNGIAMSFFVISEASNIFVHRTDRTFTSLESWFSALLHLGMEERAEKYRRRRTDGEDSVWRSQVKFYLFLARSPILYPYEKVMLFWFPFTVVYIAIVARWRGTMEDGHWTLDNACGVCASAVTSSCHSWFM